MTGEDICRPDQADVGQFQAMMPKLRSTNFEGMELIRPMYLIREEDILRWRDANGLQFLQCACRFTERSADDVVLNKVLGYKIHGERHSFLEDY